MVSRSGIIDGVMIAAGIILLSQSIGGIESLILSKFAPIMIFSAFWTVLFVVAGAFLVHRVYNRRKKRKAVEQKALEPYNPIGLSAITLGKAQDSRPKGVAIIAYLSLIGGVLGIALAGWMIRAPTLFPKQNDFLSYPVVGIVLSISSAIAGYGLLSRKKRGWKWGVIGFFIDIGLTIADSLTGLPLEGQVINIATVITSLLILYYLYRAYVKAHFGITSNNPFVRER